MQPRGEWSGGSLTASSKAVEDRPSTTSKDSKTPRRLASRATTRLESSGASNAYLIVLGYR